MTIILNGENYTTKGADAVGAITVAGLLDELGIGPGAVAVEVNLSIVKKALYAETAIREGDSVEIVNFVGGG
jgi:thiamine biosynthesis protein ThiS